LLEFIGVFLFDGFLSIAEERIDAAKVVYHCMCLTTFLQIVVTPASTLITSHENFMYSSFVSIVESLLKLSIAFYLISTSYDKLVVYGILMTAVVVVSTLLLIIYVYLKFPKEAHVGVPSATGIKQQTGFAGWTLFDILGSVLNRQGYSIMLNKFFGTGTNAVFAISRQIEGQIYCVSAAVIDTVKPQIMKSYSIGDNERMFRLSITAGKFGFSLMSFVCIPLLVMMPEILIIWLKNVPDGTVLFARLMVSSCMIEQITRGLVYANQATGNIKRFSIIVSTVRAMALPISILSCFLGYEAYVTIVLFIIFESLGSFSRIIVMSKLHNLNPLSFIKEIVRYMIIPFILAFTICFFLNNVNHTLWYMLFNIILTSIIYATSMFLFGLTKEEKKAIVGVVN